MKLKTLLLNYIAHRKAMGEKFRTNEDMLKAFCKYMGDDIAIECISPEKIEAYLHGKGSLTSTWFIRHNALAGFYSYAISRGYVDSSPLPTILPKRPPAFVPYIYTREELRKLLEATLTYQKRRSHVHPYMVNRMLLVLYGTGLRLSEALSLTMADIDLNRSTITVNETKFYKRRLVPFGSQLAEVIREYIVWRNGQRFPAEKDSPFFYRSDDTPLNMNLLEVSFMRIRKKAGIRRSDAKQQPRLHDLRHTFAVHRLMSWYRANADVQQLLPVLSVYMGHTHLAATSVYLTMTNDLLQEAGKRFEKYARGENNGQQ